MKSSREYARKVRRVASVRNLIKKDTLPQVFSCEFSKFLRTPFTPSAATDRWEIIKLITL